VKRALTLLACILVAGCSGAKQPKPLPQGPPPEYEAPRSFDLPGAEPTDAQPPAADEPPEASPPPAPQPQ